MARVTVSESELLEALKTATDAHMNPDDAYTVVEICEATSCGREVTCRKLNRLKTANLIEVVSLRREALDGRMRVVPGYRFLKPKKKRAA